MFLVPSRVERALTEGLIRCIHEGDRITPEPADDEDRDWITLESADDDDDDDDEREMTTSPILDLILLHPALFALRHIHTVSIVIQLLSSESH